MNINPKYVIYHDLIGFYALAKAVPKGMDFEEIGEIIDETKNMLITKRNDKVKKYIKQDHVFRLKMSEQELLEIEGTKIVGRPENRLRALRKKKLFKK